jgi:hypothetical protein
MLFEHMEQVQRFIHDSTQQMIDPQNLITYVNKARREVAMRAQCVRVLTPITGPISDYSIVSSGSGYINPIVAVSAPDFPSGVAPTPNGAQATATAFVQNGTIAGINSVYGGDGYFQPQVVVTDVAGTGASVAAITVPLNVLNRGQEVYPFSGVNLSRNPGVKSVYSVKGISIIYSNYRYSLPVYSFSVYQAKIRQYPFQFQWVPSMATQYGRGTAGSFYTYPIASQTYQFELDCLCIPKDLTADQDLEVIPDPWTDAVPFLAAYYAYLELQNLNAGNFYLMQFNDWVSRFSQHTLPGRSTNPYGRWAWLVSIGMSAAALLGVASC